MIDIVNDLFEVTDNTHYVRYNEVVEIALKHNLHINKLSYELSQLKGVELKWSGKQFTHRRFYGLKIKDELTMKVIFEGTQQQIKQEMEQWLNELNKQESLNNVSTKLSQHNITLTQNENDVLPMRFVKQTCQLKGHEWTLFKHELQSCGVKEKRTNKFRVLTNLKLKEEQNCK